MTTSDSAHVTATAPVALVTGANKGLGLETVARLAALGWTVHLGAASTGPTSARCPST